MSYLRLRGHLLKTLCGFLMWQEELNYTIVSESHENQYYHFLTDFLLLLVRFLRCLEVLPRRLLLLLCLLLLCEVCVCQRSQRELRLNRGRRERERDNDGQGCAKYVEPRSGDRMETLCRLLCCSHGKGEVSHPTPADGSRVSPSLPPLLLLHHSTRGDVFKDDFYLLASPAIW